jgi:3',5'-cyclic AMP phosphodiesterase CpdA
MHHHLLPIPGTGRERNIVFDAGDAIECLQRSKVDLVLAGHKHVPYAWRLEDLFVVNTGTVSTTRLRGNTRPCYNVVEITGDHGAALRRCQETARRARAAGGSRQHGGRDRAPA